MLPLLRVLAATAGKAGHRGLGLAGAGRRLVPGLPGAEVLVAPAAATKPQDRSSAESARSLTAAATRTWASSAAWSSAAFLRAPEKVVACPAADKMEAKAVVVVVGTPRAAAAKTEGPAVAEYAFAVEGDVLAALLAGRRVAAGSVEAPVAFVVDPALSALTGATCVLGTGAAGGAIPVRSGPAVALDGHFGDEQDKGALGLGGGEGCRRSAHDGQPGVGGLRRDILGDGAAGVDGDGRPAALAPVFADDTPATTAPRGIGVSALGGCLQVQAPQLSAAAALGPAGRGYDSELDGTDVAAGHGLGAAGLDGDIKAGPTPALAGAAPALTASSGLRVYHAKNIIHVLPIFPTGALGQVGRRYCCSGPAGGDEGTGARGEGVKGGPGAGDEGRKGGSGSGEEAGTGSGGVEKEAGKAGSGADGADLAVGGKGGGLSTGGTGCKGHRLPRRPHPRGLEAKLNRLQRTIDMLVCFSLDHRGELTMRADQLHRQVGNLPLKFLGALVLGISLMAYVVVEIILPKVVAAVYSEFLRLANELKDVANEVDEEKMKRLAGQMAKVVMDTVMAYFGGEIRKEIAKKLKFWSKE